MKPRIKVAWLAIAGNRVWQCRDETRLTTYGLTPRDAYAAWHFMCNLGLHYGEWTPRSTTTPANQPHR